MRRKQKRKDKNRNTIQIRKKQNVCYSVTGFRRVNYALRTETPEYIGTYVRMYVSLCMYVWIDGSGW